MCLCEGILNRARGYCDNLVSACGVYSISPWFGETSRSHDSECHNWCPVAGYEIIQCGNVNSLKSEVFLNRRKFWIYGEEVGDLLESQGRLSGGASKPRSEGSPFFLSEGSP